MRDRIEKRVADLKQGLKQLEQQMEQIKLSYIATNAAIQEFEAMLKAGEEESSPATSPTASPDVIEDKKE